MMKNRFVKITAGLTAVAIACALLVRSRITRIERQIWQSKNHSSLDVLGCPQCHGRLELIAVSEGDAYHCSNCEKTYPVIEGIPHFIQSAELTGWNRRFARAYDFFSWGYRAFSKMAFALIGMSEEKARREITDRLEPKSGRVLEVSIGPGVNLPYLYGRPDVGEIYGLDISPGQLKRCMDFIAHRDWDVKLQLGNAEQLPYMDDSFDGVLHIGGINFFNDKQKAIEEMIRVAKPGARILICDENEKGAKAYEKFIPSFRRMTGSKREAVAAPVAMIPSDMQEIRVFDIWKGWMYCIEFIKPGKEKNDAG